ncbi:MAG: alkaline phosphatase D family protein [Elainellaceae cyanobacterium]
MVNAPSEPDFDLGIIDTLPNGVASGDVTTDAAVLWTRSVIPGDVLFELSTDAAFSAIVAAQTETVDDPLVPIKTELVDLAPATQYFYRVTDRVGEMEAGQFRTAVSLSTYSGLRFGVSGDWQGELSPYPAIGNVPERDLDFFVQMGDTVEADSESAALPGVTQAQTLEEFRIKHAEIYAERFGVNNWAALRAATPVYATWDDHEITNDFAGGAAPADSPQEDQIFGDAEIGFVNDTPVFEDALTAFQDYKPLRDLFYGETGDERTANEQQLYRFNTFGRDAATYTLDLRSFRDAPLPFISEAAPEEDIQAYLKSAFEPGRTLLGEAQLEQFKQDLLAAETAGITWKFVFSTVPIQNFGVPVAGERWEGYAAERAELLGFISENDIDNVVFVTGDFHGNVVNNVTYQAFFDGPQIPTDVVDVMIGPVGIQLTVPFLPEPFNETFAAPFGPATVAFTPPALLEAQGKSQAEYLSLTGVDAQNQYVREIVDARLTPLGFDPIGLEDSDIDATLLQGEYIAAHHYGWSEFAIDPATQALTVTTYGVEPYTEAALLADPDIALRVPEVRSQFAIAPADFEDAASGDPGLNFDQPGLSGGTLVSDQFEGVMISSADERTPAMLFDSERPTGGDFDLQSEDLGLVLILSEDGDASDPDDSAQGGTLSFDFDGGVSLESVDILDNEEDQSSITLYGENDTTVLEVIDIPMGHNNALQTIHLGTALGNSSVGRLDVTLENSGAVSNVSFDPVEGAAV